ncbi:MAG TPA: CpsB/CapC family capsule biosynthesis tyrosine phosphatase, partial [bacterium]
MIDIHTHILPDLDDGPSTLVEALDLAAAAYDCGTRAMIATPHVLGRLNPNQNVLI